MSDGDKPGVKCGPKEPLPAKNKIKRTTEKKWLNNFKQHQKACNSQQKRVRREQSFHMTFTVKLTVQAIFDLHWKKVYDKMRILTPCNSFF
jgi:hypothetical protein